MTDRELLELAAKAAGYTLGKHTQGDAFTLGGQEWNPLTDDADALQLAVKLDLHIRFYRKHVDVDAEVHGKGIVSEYFTAFKDADTRLAIVRAAAEIGRQMK